MPAAAVLTARTAMIAVTLAARNAPRPSGRVSHMAAVPRSFSVATEPMASPMATSTPVCPMLRTNWATASAVVGGGTSMVTPCCCDSVPMISGSRRASSGETMPKARYTIATTGSRRVRHASRSSLSSMTPKPVMPRGTPTDAR